MTRLGALFRELVTASRRGDPAIMAAVIALPRSASKYLYGVLLNALDDRTPLFHSHGVSARRVASVREHGAREKDRLTLDKTRRLAAALDEPGRQYIFVPYRDPVARIYSAYLLDRERRSPRIENLFDPESASFRDPGGIAADLAAFAESQLWVQGQWFRREIEEVLDIRLERLPSPAAGGWSIADLGGRRIVLLRVEDLDAALAAALFPQFPVREARRWDERDGERVLRYGVGRRNSASERGVEGLDRALRRSFPLSEALVDALYGLPEVRRIWSADAIAARKQELRISARFAARPSLQPPARV